MQLIASTTRAFETDRSSRFAGERGDLTEYPLPADSDPAFITFGSDARIWFTEPRKDRISACTPGGLVVQHPLPRGTAPLAITLGCDGRVWFTTASNRIGAITPSGLVTLYPLSGNRAFGATSPPSSITVGPDDNVWFTRPERNAVARVTSHGAVTELTLPAACASPSGIATGSDGNVWVAEYGADRIARVSTGGTVTEFPLPTAKGPLGVVRGLDERIWVTAEGAIVAVTLDGEMTEFPLKAAGLCPAISIALDQSLWLSMPRDDALGRITPSGQLTKYALPRGSRPFGISFVPWLTGWGFLDVWFTQRGTARLGKVRALAND